MSITPPEPFFKRWTRRKAEHVSGGGAASATLPASVVPDAKPVPSRQPTLADVAGLMADADYSSFITAGIDKTVHRAAMKKLFAEPHFNVMDGLDIYISDYNVASPVSPAMLAGLVHAKSTLDPKPAWRVEESDVAPAAPADINMQVVAEPDAAGAALNLDEADKDAELPLSGEHASADPGLQAPPVLAHVDAEQGVPT